MWRGGEGKEKEAEVDGQCGLDGDVTVGRGDAEPGCVGATRRIHRPLIEVGKVTVEEEEFCILVPPFIPCRLYRHRDILQRRPSKIVNAVSVSPMCH